MPPPVRARIVLFTRYPRAGRVKTRLIPALGPEGAAALQRRMSEEMVAHLRLLTAEGRATMEVRYEGGSPERMAEWLGRDLPLAAQGEGDLGARLERAAAAAFAQGATRLLLIGADCPALTPPLLRRALACLEEHDLVLGPAADGGYYLIGLRRPWPELFRDIPWGGGGVLAATLARAARPGVSIRLLEEHADVDRPEDLRHLRHHPRP